MLAKPPAQDLAQFAVLEKCTCVPARVRAHRDTCADRLGCSGWSRAVARTCSCPRRFLTPLAGGTATPERYSWEVSIQLLAWTHMVPRAPWRPRLAVT